MIVVQVGVKTECKTKILVAAPYKKHQNDVNK
jgi:hypothetical protein